MDSLTVAQSERAQARLAEIRSTISARLWSVNTGMSSASYNELMDAMALLQLNCEMREARGPGTLDTRAGPPERRGKGPARV